jgi:hypothetical protein
MINCTPYEDDANYAIADLASHAAIAIDNLSLGREYDRSAITNLVDQANTVIPKLIQTRLLKINPKQPYAEIKELREFCVDLSRRTSATGKSPFECFSHD